LIRFWQRLYIPSLLDFIAAGAIADELSDTLKKTMLLLALHGVYRVGSAKDTERSSTN
jgi:hypothetical protein